MENAQISSEDYDFIVGITRKLIDRNVPEESDIVVEVVEQTYLPNSAKDSQAKFDRKFSFSGYESATQFVSGTLAFLLPKVVFPFLSKIWKELEKRATEKSAGEIASRLEYLISRLKGESDNEDLQHQVDLLIPVNWEGMERRLKKTAIEKGFSTEVTGRATEIIVRELSEDRILLGDAIIHVSRKKISS